MKIASRSGFTLVELIMVIGIIALLSLLVVPKLSGLRSDTKIKTNIANMKRIDNAIETYLVANPNKGINRLDALIKYGTAAQSGTRGAAVYSGLDTPPEIIDNSLKSATNQGLHTNLVTVTTAYGSSYSPLLGTYYLSSAEAAALNAWGMKYSMRGTDGNRMRTGDDGVWAQGSVTDPDKCSAVASFITNGVAVAVVNPRSVSSSIQPSGAEVYNACGQKVFFTVSQKILIDDVEYASNEEAFKALQAVGGGGILLAFGLGENASLVGENQAGIDAAPVCPDCDTNVYRRYLVLVRLRNTASNGVEVEYAGLMDPRGRTLRSLASIAK